MIGLGLYNDLIASHHTPQGWYFADEQGTEVLLPTREILGPIEEGDTLSLFCYLDHEERPVLTQKIPYIQRGEIAVLEIVDENSKGYFLNWGLQKQLFMPYRESREGLKVGSRVTVYCSMDELSGRLFASARWKRQIEPIEEKYEKGDELEVLIVSKTDLGFECLFKINRLGLLYHGPDTSTLQVGDRIKAYILKQREDLKVDLNVRKLGVLAIDEGAKELLELLKAQPEKRLKLTDKSSPEEIAEWLSMSKKLFKKSVGQLYKARMIVLEQEGIKLTDSNI